jgi:hypothetical protein
MKKIASHALRYLLIVAAFAPLVYLVYQQWPEVQEAFTGIDGWLLLWATLLLMVILPTMASISWISLRSLGVDFSFRKAFSIYFITQAPKYLPGGFWAFPGRMIAYQLAQVEQARSIISVVREVAALFVGATLVGALILFQGLQIDPAFQGAVALGMLACVALTGLMQFRAFWKVAARILRSEKFAFLAEAQTKQILSFAWIPGAVICSLLFWLAMGVPFRQLCMAINPALARLNVFQAASLFALSWSIGFAFVVVPAGFGVRESALTILLSGLAPAGDAVAIALISRLWWMLVEAVCVAISFWLLDAESGLSRFWQRPRSKGV